MEVRELLCLRTSRELVLPQEALATGWRPCPVSTINEAMMLYEQRHPLVGIIFLDQFGIDINADCEVEAFLAYTSNETTWIGLVSAENIKHPAISNLFAKYLYDYHTLPVDDARLLTILGHAYGMASLRRHPPVHSSLMSANRDKMIGESLAMKKVRHQLEKFAAVDSSVMLSGESGTGKELAAHIIYQHSRRRNAPFIAVNCGAIPGNLIQSELFGHEKGSFTGAFKRQIGHIEAAASGTLFLDEVGDLPLELQVNLLRFLQEKQITRIGGTKPIHVDLRVISATNRDLQNDIMTGRFRKDLYFRLCVLDLELPPLRERQGDAELLACHFLYHMAPTLNPKVRGFSPAALQLIRTYQWPGNVRELKNRVARALVMCESRVIDPPDLGLKCAATSSDAQHQERKTLAEARAEAEAEATQQALQSCGYNVAAAARQLGVSRVTLYRMMEKYHLMTP